MCAFCTFSFLLKTEIIVLEAVSICYFISIFRTGDL